jgi:tripartite-type tricarboxylate transporter receptor subunit TctC
VTSGYPSRPVRYIVPFGSGPTAAQAHWLARGLTRALGQPVIVENHPGGSGMKGTALVADAAPDGYTLLAANPGPLTVGPNVHEAPGYDLSAFAPIVLIATLPSVIAVHPASNIASIAQLIARARSEPGSIVCGSPGSGTVGHLALELLQHLARIRMTHLPREGLAEAIPELLQGRFDVLVIPMSDARPLVLAGRLCALAVTTRSRAAAWPDLVTADEAGVAGFGSFNWNGVAAPRGTPEPVIDRINSAVNALLESAAGRAELTANCYDIAGGTAAEFGAFLVAERDKWAGVARRAGLTRVTEARA